MTELDTPYGDTYLLFLFLAFVFSLPLSIHQPADHDAAAICIKDPVASDSVSGLQQNMRARAGLDPSR